MKKINALTLFSNVGIDESYLDQLNIDVKISNELLEDRAEFYRELYPDVDMISGSIMDDSVYDTVEQRSKEVGIDLILATPPCQGMSMANAKRADKNDPRNSLIKRVVSLINSLDPSYVLIENVPDMQKTYISHDDEEVLILDYLSDNIPEDYEITYKVLDCADYGTPQSRKRLITLISKCGKWEHPEPTTPEHITVRDTIDFLPSLESGETSDIPWHSGKNANKNHISWMKHTPSGKSAFSNENFKYQPTTIDKETGEERLIKGFKTTYKRISWDKPSPTITMLNGSINSQNNVHPGRKKKDGTYSDARVLSVREILILCGLPADWLDDHQDRNENFIRKVLGECFPPNFCLEIMKTLPNRR